ncbi:helix-hairpin-helix domain-containing protein [Xylocopilactobacillus apis]|uniref:Helix-hairpin-helix DNA-binding motif class 1 domain-containing protein n=1 Tax=Xylocopilactobacillus apis TaxID=2932183 RepID=A0AAU9DTS8_9LACO|nr:helix-hairpin-helix domain-containing protein [Xylocopilactobacillus apis]BDR57198.1 hypothetical protein KIMC2_17600 [Xylocopilactobacillus apis]
MKNIVKKYYLAIIAGAVIIIGGVVMIFFSQAKGQNAAKENEQLFSSQKKSSSKTVTAEVKNQSKFVEIKGAVVKPGIYPIKANTRLAEVLQQAGGATPNADLKTVNLAKVAHDQESFYIPQKGEAPAPAEKNPAVSEEAPVEAKSDLVDLNTADLTKLQTLNGIGAKKAEKILEYRKEKGQFKKIDELKNVNGIGDKTYESIKDQITVSP